MVKKKETIIIEYTFSKSEVADMVQMYLRSKELPMQGTIKFYGTPLQDGVAVDGFTVTVTTTSDNQ